MVTDEAIAAVMEMLLRDPEKAMALLSEKDQQSYREAQESIIRAAHWSHPRYRW